MRFTKESQSTANLLLPISAMAGAFYYSAIKQKQKTTEILITVAVVGLLVWLLTRTITKQLVTLSEAPDHVNVDPDAAGTVDADFDPTQLTNKLHDDIVEVWGMRDGDIYEQLDGLSNANLMKVYNDWTDRFWSEDNETMVQAMEGENYGITSSYTYHSENIITRLKGMGAN